MASSQTRRRSERHRDNKAVDERDTIDGHSVRSSRRASYHTDRSQRTAQPQIFKNNGGITIKNSNVYFGVGFDEKSQPSRSSPVPRPTSRVGYKKKSDRYFTEESDSELSAYSSRDESPPSARIRSMQPPPSHISSAITPHRNRTFPKDEGYGSVASTKSYSRKRGTAETIQQEYNSDLSRRSSNASLATDSTRSRRTKRPKSRAGSGTEDDEEEASIGDTHLAKQGDDNKRENDSEDELGFETIQVSDKDDNQHDVEAILDTGTKPDWVSASFLKKMRVKEENLDGDNNTEYTDFNGRGFKATGKAHLMIMNDNFPKSPCRRITFLVTKKGKFEILFGRKTIFKEGLLQRPPKDISGEGVYAGYQKGPKKEEKEYIARRKAEQAKQGDEEDKKRVEEKRKAKLKEKQEGRTNLANFAPEIKPAQTKEMERSRSPPRASKAGAIRASQSPSSKISRHAKEKTSSSSLDDVDGGGVRL